MDFQLSDEQKLISEAAREFADKEIAPRVKENDRAARFDRELASKLGEVGYLGAPVAEEYGGRGLDYLGYGLIVEQVGRADSSARTVVSVQTSLVAGSIEQLGHRGAEAEVAAEPLLGRVAGLLRADRARHRLRRRQPAHAGDEDRLGLVDQRPEDVDQPRQLLRGGADLRPDRPREEAQGPRLLPGPDRQRGLHHPGDPRQARAALLRHRGDLARLGRGRRGRDARRDRRRLQGRDERPRQRPLQRRRRLRRDLRRLRRSLGRLRQGARTVRRAAGPLPARPGDDRRHDPQARRQPDAGLPGRRAEGRKEAEHDRDLGGEALRDRVGGRMREPGDPGPRRRRLRRRLPGRALPARRPGDDPLRGHLADPEDDHRPRRDRDQRDDAAWWGPERRWPSWSRARSTATSRCCG